jgi:hypothetical protein
MPCIKLTLIRSFLKKNFRSKKHEKIAQIPVVFYTPCNDFTIFSFPTSSAELQLRSIPNGNITSLENMSKSNRTAVKTITNLINMSEETFSEQILEPQFKNMYVFWGCG